MSTEKYIKKEQAEKYYNILNAIYTQIRIDNNPFLNVTKLCKDFKMDSFFLEVLCRNSVLNRLEDRDKNGSFFYKWVYERELSIDLAEEMILKKRSYFADLKFEKEQKERNEAKEFEQQKINQIQSLLSFGFLKSIETVADSKAVSDINSLLNVLNHNPICNLLKLEIKNKNTDKLEYKTLYELIQDNLISLKKSLSNDSKISDDLKDVHDKIKEYYIKNTSYDVSEYFINKEGVEDFLRNTGRGMIIPSPESIDGFATIYYKKTLIND